MDRVTVVGIGKLGLGFALLLERGGYDVCGVDIFPDYVKALNEKTFRTNEPEYNDLLQQSTNFHAVTSLEEGLRFSDLVFILVQTPNGGGSRFYDHAVLSKLLCDINKLQVKNKHIVIGCTVMPKYINDVGTLLIKDCENTTLNYNPEFIAQGEIIKGFRSPDLILIGTEHAQLASQLRGIYASFVRSEPRYCIVKPLEAELVKISINGFITTKLSFANMLSDLCDNIGANKDTVLDVVGSDSRIGNKYFRPGFSFGGPCFPRDTKALKQIMDQNNVNSEMLVATTRMNELHNAFIAEQLLKENKAEYRLSNVCYKENCNVPIIEESAKCKIAEYLAKRGKRVIIEDEAHMILEVQKEYGTLFEYEVRQ
jgi:nucleotide sugar dehydrogenase